jgi:hypothetical protein
MNKHRSVKKMIERAIESCDGSEFREVREMLSDALRAVKRSESRSESKPPEPVQQWKFDIATSSMKNLTRSQMKDALGRIESMIEGEKKRLVPDGKQMFIAE